MVELNLKLPESFFEEENLCGFKVERKMKEIWAVELDLLNELIRVCKKHDLKLYASGGTLIGVVRHHGFIPWDDDIDIMMMREDYEKLCKIAEDEFQAPYFFQTEYTDPGTLRGHAQLRNSNTTAILYTEKGQYEFNQGIFIDIFPCDNVLEDNVLFRKQGKEAVFYLEFARKCQRSLYRHFTPEEMTLKKKLIYPVLSRLTKFFNLEERAFRKYEKVCQRYNDRDTRLISLLSFQFMNKAHFKFKEDFNELIWAPYETIEMPIGNNSDRTLRMQYGDYMTMKKENSYHGTVFFDTDRSYKEYEPIGPRKVPEPEE